MLTFYFKHVYTTEMYTCFKNVKPANGIEPLTNALQMQRSAN